MGLKKKEDSLIGDPLGVFQLPRRRNKRGEKKSGGKKEKKVSGYKEVLLLQRQLGKKRKRTTERRRVKGEGKHPDEKKCRVFLNDLQMEKKRDSAAR